MPGLPQQPPHSPPRLRHDDRNLVSWADGVVNVIVRLWGTLVYVVNALSLTDTLANRTTTPGLNHIFFTASDSKQTFVGVSGTWENVGPRRGSATITAGATTVAVTLSPAEPDTNYRLSLSTNYDHGRMWWTSKATSGFTVNVATAAPGGGATVDWTLTRD